MKRNLLFFTAVVVALVFALYLQHTQSLEKQSALNRPQLNQQCLECFSGMSFSGQVISVRRNEQKYGRGRYEVSVLVNDTINHNCCPLFSSKGSVLQIYFPNHYIDNTRNIEWQGSMIEKRANETGIFLKGEEDSTTIEINYWY